MRHDVFAPAGCDGNGTAAVVADVGVGDAADSAGDAAERDLSSSRRAEGQAEDCSATRDAMSHQYGDASRFRSAR
jgi:hypothetical protein